MSFPLMSVYTDFNSCNRDVENRVRYGYPTSVTEENLLHRNSYLGRDESEIGDVRIMKVGGIGIVIFMGVIVKTPSRRRRQFFHAGPRAAPPPDGLSGDTNYIFKRSGDGAYNSCKTRLSKLPPSLLVLHKEYLIRGSSRCRDEFMFTTLKSYVIETACLA
ncbi:hypothetical protein EVAR_9317_1 [Eumeta japonica]|uniref:Uncharacterized protein n=1 Tax=Eumeta variegata TaxID=151549 RepID=A0A4C1TM05_EUMVA|nr:hypothetical protein EVAR_9317_1 [Eumeta japonica]